MVSRPHIQAYQGSEHSAWYFWSIPQTFPVPSPSSPARVFFAEKPGASGTCGEIPGFFAPYESKTLCSPKQLRKLRFTFISVRVWTPCTGSPAGLRGSPFVSLVDGPLHRGATRTRHAPRRRTERIPLSGCYRRSHQPPYSRRPPVPSLSRINRAHLPWKLDPQK